jgi:hypothetical protein
VSAHPELQVALDALSESEASLARVRREICEALVANDHQAPGESTSEFTRWSLIAALKALSEAEHSADEAHVAAGAVQLAAKADLPGRWRAVHRDGAVLMCAEGWASGPGTDVAVVLVRHPEGWVHVGEGALITGGWTMAAFETLADCCDGIAADLGLDAAALRRGLNELAMQLVAARKDGAR